MAHVPHKELSLDERLLRVANSTQFPDDLRLQALMAIGPRRVVKRPAQQESQADVLRAVLADNRAPVDLRVRAAKVLLQPAGDPGANGETK